MHGHTREPVCLCLILNVFAWFGWLNALTTRGSTAAVSWLLSVHCLQGGSQRSRKRAVMLSQKKTYDKQRVTDELEVGRDEGRVRRMSEGLKERAWGGSTVSRWEWVRHGKSNLEGEGTNWTDGSDSSGDVDGVMCRTALQDALRSEKDSENSSFILLSFISSVMPLFSLPTVRSIFSLFWSQRSCCFSPFLIWCLLPLYAHLFLSFFLLLFLPFLSACPYLTCGLQFSRDITALVRWETWGDSPHSDLLFAHVGAGKSQMNSPFRCIYIWDDYTWCHVFFSVWVRFAKPNVLKVSVSRLLNISVYFP